MAVLTGIELCAGVGMLGEGVRAALGFLGHEYRTVCYVEREAAAAGQLVTLMEAGIIDPAPVWSDMLTFDGAAWRGRVDCIIAGFPCQDLSIAGRRAGLDGERSGLFFRVCDIADDCGAQFLILENVSAIASATASVVDEAEGELEERAAARVMGELADRGWDAEWITLSASDVGASHRRARWFCFAWRVVDTKRAERRAQRTTGSRGFQGHDRSGQAHCGPGIAEQALGNARLQHQHPEQRADGAEYQGAGSAVADPENTNGRSEQQPRGTGRWRSGLTGICSGVADSCSKGCERREQCRTRIDNRGGQEAHGPTSELCCALGIFAPGPDSTDWPGILDRFPHLAPATEPGLCGVVDGHPLVVDESRTHQLRAIGNGVVPLQAAVALVTLMRRAGISIE